MPYPLAAARGHDTAQGGAAVPVQQPYLLNLATYTTGVTTNWTLGREFQVAAAAQCYGIRVKLSGILTVNIHLWRTDTAAQVAVRNAITTASGANELLFTTPVTLSTSLTYRIAIFANPLGWYYLNGADHPDGPVTILTANTYCYLAYNDGYPASSNNSYSLAAEPIIYA